MSISNDNFNGPVPLSQDDYRRACIVVNSSLPIGQFASCEWAELGSDGQTWIAAVVREARNQALSEVAQRPGAAPT